MASVIKRTADANGIYELLTSANTPDYLVADWIHNPDLSALTGVPKSRWIVVGDTVREMTAAEQDINILSSVKASKLLAIDARTDALIASGFVYSSKTFSLSLPAQIKMNGSHMVRDDPSFTYPVIWNTMDDNDTISLADSAALDAFYLTALGTVRSHLDSGTALKDQARAAVTVAVINAIVDNR